ncbi:MAG TPA: hypothetical protein VFB28_11960 [Terriglobales bacterium]|nr:hypothetical protein [Terriglobales bacterium]
MQRLSDILLQAAWLTGKPMPHELEKLAIALGAAFIVPGIGYAVGTAWTNFVEKTFGRGPDPRLRKLASTFFLGLPVFLLASYVRFDFDGLHDWWLQAPVLVTVLLLLVLILLPALLATAIVRIWRADSHSQDENG